MARILRWIPLYAWLLFTIVFFGYAILASLSTTRGIFTNSLFGGGLHFSNYTALFREEKMGRYFLNSVIYTVFACAGILVVVSPAAYVMGRVRFRGRGAVRMMFLSAMAIPSLLIMLPLFSMFIQFHLTGSIATLVLVYIFVNVPFGVFLLSGFFTNIPGDLEEAAAIDGCGPVRAFVSVMLPIAQPGLVTLTIFNFMGIWNDYFFALIFANDPQRQTLALALQSITYSYGNTGNYAGIFAASVVVFVPTFVFYLLLSKRIVGGVTAGAVKG